LDLATGEVTEVGTSADPSFGYPMGVSGGDPSGRFLYAADMLNNIARQIDLASGEVKVMAPAVSPSFSFPEAVAVDPNGQMIYVADSGNSLIRRVDIASGSVKSMGTSANPPFKQPAGVAVDPSGQWLYVADTQNDLIRRVELVETVSNVALRSPPSAFSIDLSSSDSAASLTELPAIAAASLPGVVTADGSCEGVAEDRMCLSLVYSEFNAETSTLWLDLLNAASGYHFLQAYSASPQPPRPLVLSSSVSRRALLIAGQGLMLYAY
jgi:DNA-binding beta-propeller fold protein YncE